MRTLSKTFLALGTVNTVTVPEAHRETAETIQSRILSLHKKWNLFDPDSEVSAINRCAGTCPAPVTPETLQLLTDSLKLSRMTNGAFCVTVCPAIRLWKNAGKTGRLPTLSQIERVRQLVADSELTIDRKRAEAALSGTGQGIDFGSIAKGFAADMAWSLLNDDAVEHALLNFGGTVVVKGGARSIGIQNPFAARGTCIGSVTVQNQAVVTSGLYEQFFRIQGKSYHHIIDPSTCCPSESGLVSVTLIGDCAEQLDALTTALFVLGIRDGYDLIRENDVEAVLIDQNANVIATDGLKGNLKLNGGI